MQEYNFKDTWQWIMGSKNALEKINISRNAFHKEDFWMSTAGP